MAQEGWDDVNELLRQIRVDASGRLIIVPFGQYLETPPSLSDEDYFQITLTSDGKLRTDDPTTQAKVDEVLVILESEVYGNEAIQDAVGAIDTATMRGTDGAALASAWTAPLATVLANYTAVRAGYLDQLDFNLQEAIAAIPTTMRGTDNAALASAWTSALATALGNYTAGRAGYLDELDFALQEAIAAIPTTMVGTNNAALASSWTAALATALGNYTEARAVYLDQLDFNLQEAIAAIPTTMRGTDNAALASAWTAALATALGNYTAGRAAYLDQLDFNLQEAIAAIDTSAMRGTDGAALASAWTAPLATILGNFTAVRIGYLDQLDFALQEAIAAIPTTAMRGTDGAALASAWTAALATALGNYTAGRAAYLDELDFGLQEAIAAIPTTAMRGTDNALLAANYTAERGTDSAALASSWTAALATALSAYTAAKAAFLDIAISAVWDELLADHTTAGSLAEFIKWAQGDYVHLYEHFEVWDTITDMKIPYTSSVTNGSIVHNVDDLPSVVRLITNGAENDTATLWMDRTVSLLGLGGTKLVVEWRAKLSTELSIIFTLGLTNLTTNSDRIWVRMDTNIADINTGGIRVDIAGVTNYTETNIKGGFDMTAFHVYRLEIIPSTSVELFIDDVSQGSESTGANVPPDQSWRPHFSVYARGGGIKSLDVDYFKVWSE